MEWPARLPSEVPEVTLSTAKKRAMWRSISELNSIAGTTGSCTYRVLHDISVSRIRALQSELLVWQAAHDLASRQPIELSEELIGLPGKEALSAGETDGDAFIQL